MGLSWWITWQEHRVLGMIGIESLSRSRWWRSKTIRSIPPASFYFLSFSRTILFLLAGTRMRQFGGDSCVLLAPSNANGSFLTCFLKRLSSLYPCKELPYPSININGVIPAFILSRRSWPADDVGWRTWRTLNDHLILKSNQLKLDVLLLLLWYSLYRGIRRAGVYIAESRTKFVDSCLMCAFGSI